MAAAKATSKATSVVTKLMKIGTPVVKYIRVKVPEKALIIKKYAVVELVPPTPAEIMKAPGDLQKIIAKAQDGSWREFTVAETLLNTVVCLEVCMWFLFGECIGKRSLIGYQIEGACNWEAHI